MLTNRSSKNALNRTVVKNKRESVEERHRHQTQDWGKSEGDPGIALGSTVFAYN